MRGPLRELVIGILIAEDLIAILLMATLTAVAGGAGLSALEMAKTTGKLFGFPTASEILVVGDRLGLAGTRAAAKDLLRPAAAN